MAKQNIFDNESSWFVDNVTKACESRLLLHYFLSASSFFLTFMAQLENRITHINQITGKPFLNITKGNSNRNANIDRCDLLRSNKNLSNNKNIEKNKKSLLSNTIEGKYPSNKVKKLKNQFPLFFNTHHYSVNNDNLEYTTNSKKKKTNTLI